MKILATFVITLFSILSLTSQKEFKKGYIQYKEGDQRFGYIKEFNCDAEKIIFRTGLEKDKEKIKSSDLEEICLIVESDTFYFRKHEIVRYNGKKTKFKTYFKSAWASPVFISDEIEGFYYNFKAQQSVALTTPSGFIGFIPFSRSKAAYGIRFPEDFEIIDISMRRGRSKLNKKKFRKRLKEYLDHHCKSFESISIDKINELQTFDDFLGKYSEVCR